MSSRLCVKFALRGVALIAVLCHAPIVSATHHRVEVREIYPGAVGAPNAQFIELQAWSASQTLYAGFTVTVHDAAGTKIATYNLGNVTNGVNQATVLLATPSAATFFGITPDFTMSADIPLAAGMVCYHNFDCVSWGAFTGTTPPSPSGSPFAPSTGLQLGRAILRDATGGTSATLLDSTDDTDNSEADFDFVSAPTPKNNAGSSGALPSFPKVDLNDDGKTDFTLFRTSNGRWFSDTDANGTANLGVYFGIGGDVPVPMDYNGDGTVDLAVFRPSSGTWYLDFDKNGMHDLSVRFGSSGDVPVPADYDGDGNADIAIYRPSARKWFVDLDNNGSTDLQAIFGAAGDIPVPGDWNDDRKADFAQYRPSTGEWHVDSDRLGGHDFSMFVGGSSDRPIPADYNGDGTLDPAVYRPSTRRYIVDWNRDATPDLNRVFGASGDFPAVGDYNGDAVADIGLYRPSTRRWIIDIANDGTIDHNVVFGGTNDVIVREGSWILDTLGLTP